jgi:hypothetical protein
MDIHMDTGKDTGIAMDMVRDMDTVIVTATAIAEEEGAVAAAEEDRVTERLGTMGIY